MSLTRLLKKGSLQGVATAIPATFATDGINPPPKVAGVATVAVANAQKPAANDQAPDPADVGCWPDSTAMTGAEIELFTKRVDLFFYKNLPLPEAEKLADRLVIRDREHDDRRLCLECRHLAGYGQTSWRCGNWQAAGVAIRQRDAQLPADFARLLQRCDGFQNSLQPPAGATNLLVTSERPMP